MNWKRGFKIITHVVAVFIAIGAACCSVGTILENHSYAKNTLTAKRYDYYDKYGYVGFNERDDGIDFVPLCPTKSEMKIYKTRLEKKYKELFDKHSLTTEELFEQRPAISTLLDLENGFLVSLSKSGLIGLCVLAVLGGGIAGYVGTWVVLWYGGLAIFIFIGWLILGFADKNSKDSTMTRKKIAEYREELCCILKTDAAGRLEKLEDLAKKVGAGFVHTKLLDQVVAEKTDKETMIDKPQNPISELELVQSINNALQTETMIDMCRIANRNFLISIGVAIIAFLSALAAWAAIVKMV